jgi:acyl-CoA synthetase (AMP-forming)/AMP-acid ligase II
MLSNDAMVRFGLSGGGPLNGEVQEFIRIAFGIEFVQGYGLTETLAGLTIQAGDDLRTGIAGKPIPSVEIKLASTPEVCDRKGNPYLSTDTMDVDGNVVFGRGEIAARGPSVSSGYYMMPEQTKAEFKVRLFWCVAANAILDLNSNPCSRRRMAGSTRVTLGSSCRTVVFALWIAKRTW